MKALRGWAFGFVAATGTCFPADTPPGKWVLFESSAGFSVRYPDNWFQKARSKDLLFILSSEAGAGRAIIAPGQAFISVVEAREYKDLSLEQLRDLYNRGIAILARRQIHNARLGADACRDLYQVVSKESAIPPGNTPIPHPAAAPYLVNTEYFCQIDRKKYVTVLRNFEGDKKQAQYQEVALGVAQSLRALH